MGETRDFFKKIRDTKELFQAKMDTIKDRNGMDLTGAEDEYFFPFCLCLSLLFFSQLFVRQRRKGKIYPSECRVPKNSKER